MATDTLGSCIRPAYTVVTAPTTSIHRVCVCEWVTVMFSVVLLWSSRPQRCRGRLLQADGWGKTFLFLCTVLSAQTAAGSWHSLLAQREADPAPQQPTGLCVCLCVLVCVCVVTGRLEATRDQHMMTRQNRAHTHTLCAQRSSCSFRNNGGVYCRALWDCIVFCNDDRMQWELKASMKSTHLFNCKIDLTTFLWDSNSLLVFKST